ncbi:asparaginase [Brochothrix thermosphacta]|uniref:asparaginase n=1 Tax=Brochothrix thermosphacta TaxID=2756 RepID=UPI00083F69F2|nr:asparaginase [Brochothrix thermosphacta]ODJ62165.1 L-asparaginase 1 [Brochothrix thermosphacta]
MKILVLATGGTIASVETDNGLLPGLNVEELRRYFTEQNKQYSQSELDLDFHLLMNKDSTNISPHDWVTIAQAVETHYNDYDAFIITHGTDTLGYTAAALSYMLQGFDKAVVLTGSQIPLSFHKTDAKRNVRDALTYCLEGQPGVFVVFDGKVIQGTRAVKIRTKSYDAFESINHPYIAKIIDGHVDMCASPAQKTERLQFETQLCSDIFLLKLFPGLKASFFDAIADNYKGIIIESFGNGGLPFEDENILDRVGNLTKRGISVVMTTQCLEEGENLLLYEVGQKVAQYPIILSGDMNTEAIVPKLMWALGQTTDPTEVKTLFETPIGGDLSADWDMQITP